MRFDDDTYEQLGELHRWMIDHSVLEVEVNGVRMKLDPSVLDVDQPEVEDEDDERPAAPATHESLRAAAAAARKPRDA
jgi:hypothetical protein